METPKILGFLLSVLVAVYYIAHGIPEAWASIKVAKDKAKKKAVLRNKTVIWGKCAAYCLLLAAPVLFHIVVLTA